MASNLVASLTLRIRALGRESIRSVGTEIKGVTQKASALKKALELAGNANQAAEGFGRVANGIQQALQGPIDKFSEFELALVRARGKMDEISDRDFGRMKAAALDAATTTQFSATEAADGLGEMAAAGFSVNQQIAALPGVLGLAAAGEVSVGRATAIAANAMSQFGLKAEDVGKIGDTLVSASNASTIGLEEIAESLKYVGPIAKSAGLSLQSTSAFVALLGNSGIEASSAGTALRGMIASMAAPSSKSKKALAELGMTTADLAKGVEDPISVLAKLNERFDAKHFTQAQKLGVIMKVFGRETSAAVSSLIEGGARVGADGSTGFAKMARTMNNAEGSVKRFTDAVNETNAAKLKNFKANVDALMISTGEKLAPALQELFAGLKPVLAGIGDWVAANPRLVADLGKAAIAIGTTAVALKGLALTVGFTTTAWRYLSVAVTASAVPFRLAGAAAITASTAMGGAQAAALAGGQTWRAAALGAGALAVQLAAVAGAAWAGWEAGKALDTVIGKAVGARGGALTTEIALREGEDDKINSTRLAYASKIPGLGWLAEAAKGNMERNRQERLAAASGYASGGAPTVGTPAVTPSTGQFNAVTGKIEIELTDARPKVRVEGKGPVSIRVGQKSAGMR